MPDNSEQYRHRCEVRTILRWRTDDRNKAIEYLSIVRSKRGDRVAQLIEKDCREQWALGNRGDENEWFIKEWTTIKSELLKNCEI